MKKQKTKKTEKTRMKRGVFANPEPEPMMSMGMFANPTPRSQALAMRKKMREHHGR